MLIAVYAGFVAVIGSIFSNVPFDDSRKFFFEKNSPCSDSENYAEAQTIKCRIQCTLRTTKHEAIWAISSSYDL